MVLRDIGLGDESNRSIQFSSSVRNLLPNIACNLREDYFGGVFIGIASFWN
jgi:hypothetical protein